MITNVTHKFILMSSGNKFYVTKINVVRKNRLKYPFTFFIGMAINVIRPGTLPFTFISNNFFLS